VLCEFNTVLRFKIFLSRALRIGGLSYPTTLD